jgi:formate dehydrogenase subunit gamma
MTGLRAFAFLAALLMLPLLLSAGAKAQDATQPINPTELAVEEGALLDALGSGEALAGRVSIPNAAAANLIKPENRDWSTLHSETMRKVTVWSLIGMLALLVIFYLVRGRIRVDAGMSGRSIRRFNWLERFAHWLAAIPFVVLALTGLNLVVGRYVLLPYIGAESFGAMTHWGKLAHNFLAWPFMLGVVLILLFWIKDNFPTSVDLQWFARGGGLFSKGEHPPARRFNGGQKLIFWTVVVGGALMSLTGLQLLFPAEAATASAWQQAQILHGIVAAVFLAIMLAHAYIGSIGMEGAFDAMGSGDVDLNWARQHHSLWVDERLGTDSRKPGSGAMAPAE